MTSRYSRLNPQLGNPASQEQPTENQTTITYSDVPLKNMAGQVYEDWRQPTSSDGSFPKYTDKDQTKVKTRPIGTPHRTSTGTSIPTIASAPWEHKLNEKHIREVPTNTETVRYFDPRRQKRRVFLDCLFMWFWTAGICGALAGTMYGFSTRRYGLTQMQKYAYNALITGLSIVLGLAFAAQFKQYAEMMRWRFLASQYRSIEEFEDVLGCDSYRSTIRIMWNGRRRGQWYPSKAQLVAAFWLIVFVVFNVCAALLGLTYSIDVSETNVHVTHGNVSVADFRYIASTPQANEGSNFFFEYEKAAANLWGQLGQYFPDVTSTLDTYDVSPQSIFINEEQNLSWYRFIDLSADGQTNRVSGRTITSQASCVEYTVTFGGYAGFNTDDNDLIYSLQWEDEYGRPFSDSIPNAATGVTTWMGNSSSDCGPRCAQMLALQTANNQSWSDNENVVPVLNPRLWACNNTVSQILGADTDGFDDPSTLFIPDAQAQYLAGAIGWTGVETQGSDLQRFMFTGKTFFNPNGNATAEDIALLVMMFTTGALSASDQLNGPRTILTGPSPNPAQVVNVKWVNAGAILAGIPIVQFFMLLGVVWFASKAIILEPSYMTAAHLLYPVIKKVGKDGCLFTVDECADRLGEGYKITYGVRPDPADPGHHDTTFVRDLDIIEEQEGFGYIRGNMPEGRYD
ncbi:hypothetical protein H2200_010155 [Cladophialophora chaetospira]|uniref:Uncharacterized protein n=1 Tax=Cladophialophora chaetospira TaxID=386627 RepID=A0AA39CEN0_9EURO|nr:hypothetical protein H2200_010155 [Cladophialophora chaetospira]